MVAVGEGGEGPCPCAGSRAAQRVPAQCALMMRRARHLLAAAPQSCCNNAMAVARQALADGGVRCRCAWQRGFPAAPGSRRGTRQFTPAGAAVLGRCSGTPQPEPWHDGATTSAAALAVAAAAAPGFGECVQQLSRAAACCCGLLAPPPSSSSSPSAEQAALGRELLHKLARLGSVSRSCACIGSPCLRQRVHGASIGAAGGARALGAAPGRRAAAGGGG
jgi:hypothetical protein